MPFGIPRFPDLIPALRPDLGQDQLKDWNNEPRNIPYLPEINPRLTITHDIDRFSRRLRGIQRNDIIAATQRIQWDVTVPAREAWKVRYIMVQSGDTSLTTWRCSVLIAGLRAAFLRIRLLEVNINPAETKLLYPLRSPRPTADETAYEFTNELEFFAGDQVRIEMFTLASGAAPEYVLSFGYELIPNRRSSQQGVPFTATVI